jgi:hypothetical protein
VARKRGKGDGRWHTATAPLANSGVKSELKGDKGGGKGGGKGSDGKGGGQGGGKGGGKGGKGGGKGGKVAREAARTVEFHRAGRRRRPPTSPRKMPANLNS